MRSILAGCSNPPRSINRSGLAMASGFSFLEFVDQTGLTIELVFYPPYHSKYNFVERCWGILEQHCNGAILDSVDTVLSWMQNMTWKGVPPIVRLLDKTYQKGVRLSKRAFRCFAERLRRSELLPKWSATILPVGAESA